MTCAFLLKENIGELNTLKPEKKTIPSSYYSDKGLMGNPYLPGYFSDKGLKGNHTFQVIIQIKVSRETIPSRLLFR